jgi:hypothetical protein
MMAGKMDNYKKHLIEHNYLEVFHILIVIYIKYPKYSTDFEEFNVSTS